MKSEQQSLWVHSRLSRSLKLKTVAQGQVGFQFHFHRKSMGETEMLQAHVIPAKTLTLQRIVKRESWKTLQKTGLSLCTVFPRPCKASR